MKQIIPFYKPKGMSSFQLVSRVRRLSGERKVGHGGALDPLAEGLLILGFGMWVVIGKENILTPIGWQ